MSSEHDFDFLAGDWNVAHSRLNGRLAGSSDWQAFSGACSMRKLMGGRGNVDENVLHLPGGTYHAVTLRAFDPETRPWAIGGLDGRAPHTLDVPVVGRFENGVGEFLADDTLNGQPIRVRFRWSDTQTDAPRWEQAFSADDGQTWEVNWRMQFTRA